jgi:trimeric autotransporter adhesin
MALVLNDRVQQTGTANTTVSFTLSGSVTGFQSFTAGVGNGNTTYYAATDTSGNWEVGLGTYSTTGPTLTRTTIYKSSNSNSAVTFSGTVTVFVTYPSSRAINQDASGNTYAPNIGGTTPSTGAFTTLSSTADISIHGISIGTGAGGVSTNTVIGTSSLSSNTTGANNVIAGYQAGLNITTATTTVAVGSQALYSVSTVAANTGVGHQALYNTTNSGNTAVGYVAGYSNNSGVNNTYIGYAAGYGNSAGSNNVGIGIQALNNNTGGNNIGVGYLSGYGVTTGYYNAIFGAYQGGTAPINGTGSNYAVMSDGAGNVVAYWQGTTGAMTNIGSINNVSAFPPLNINLQQSFGGF